MPKPKRLKPAAAAKRGILLIENDPDHSGPVKNHLKVFGGFEVYLAESVQQALRLAKQYPALRFVAMDMGLPDVKGARPDRLAGLGLLRELAQILPKAKIYIKSGIALTREAKEFIQGYSKSVVRAGGPWDSTEIVDMAKIAYSQDGMQPSIFIVHGHASDALEALITLVRDDLRLGKPIVIKNEPERGRVIIEKFEKYAKRADLVFALLTPDDLTEEGLRARQNVIFEIGYFTAALGRKSGRLILLHHHRTQKPSDMDGILTIDITGGVRQAADKIRDELKGWWGMDSGASG
jgi:CheY-like chemotaxis protein